MFQVSTSDPTEVDLTKAAIEQRLKDVTFVHRVCPLLLYSCDDVDYMYKMEGFRDY